MTDETTGSTSGPKEQGTSAPEFPRKSLIDLSRIWAGVVVEDSSAKFLFTDAINNAYEAGDEIQGKIRGIAGKDQDKKSLEERANEVITLVSKLIPPEDQLADARKSDEASKEFLSNEKTLKQLRYIDFLLDEDIIQWWLLISDANFSRLKEMVDKKELPEFLVSGAEFIRLRALSDEAFGEFLRAGLERQKDLSKANIMLGTWISTKIQEKEIAMATKGPEKPARHALIAEYFPDYPYELDKGNPNLDLEQTLEKLGATYGQIT